MKLALCIVVCALTLTAASVSAQTIHGKILVIGSTGDPAEFLKKAIVDTYYSGSIDSAQSLPSDFSQYDAVCLVLTKFQFTPLLDSASSLRLVEYLARGGKLYAEASGLLTPDPRGISHPEDSLWHLANLESESEDAVYDYYASILGVDSEFTSGINISEGRYGASQPGTYRPRGAIIPVLYGYETDFSSLADVFAWIPTDTALRIVMHHPISAMQEYYSVFFHRVLCNYFGLCEPVVVPKRGVETEQANVFVTNTMQEVYNVLGVKVAGKEETSSLPNGQYFVRVVKGKHVTIRPIVIQN